MRKLKAAVLVDIADVLERVDENQVLSLIEAIKIAGKVFLAGTGRSGYVSKLFSQRLYQAGIDVHVAGGDNSPPAVAGDLAVACSSSGRTRTTLLMAGLAKERGCRLAVVTSSPESPLGRMADIVICLPAGKDDAAASRQPMGNLFEQSAFILLDCIAMMLAEKLGISKEEMERRHANLE